MKIAKIDEKKLPLIYRLILKLPNPSVPEFFLRIPWVAFLRLSIIFYCFLNVVLLVGFPFPTNIVLASIIPAMTLVIFLRIQLEREINWWNGTFAQQDSEWNSEKILKEYLDLLEKRTRNKKN